MMLQESQSQHAISSNNGRRNPLHRLFKRSRKQMTPVSTVAPESIGGVFYASDLTKQSSSKSLDTIDTRGSDGSTSSSWSSSGTTDHHKGAPVLAKTFSRRRIYAEDKDLDEDEILGHIMVKSRRMPKKHEYLTSNHVMVNSERARRFVAPLKRIPDMDEMARKQARLMAEKHELQHQDPETLEEELVGRQPGRRIGENVSRGSDMKQIHSLMVKNLADVNNMVDRRFTCMGMGTAKSSDGMLYLCQVFRD